MTVDAHENGASSVIVAAVINWNGWRDTVICLRSIFELCGPPFQLVVCDNGSSDDSFERLSNWLTGEAGATRQAHDFGAGAQVIRFDGPFSAILQSIYLLRLPKNMGYAGAINRCITWGREALVAQDFWLLNNDVKVDSQALAQLVATARSAPDIGLCGSVLLDWDDPESIQAIGGVYRRSLAVGWHMRELPADADRRQDVFFGIDYPVGASLFATQNYLAVVGLMDDTYFLYCEEMDWVERGRRHGFRPAIALKSLVQHKEGASTGSHGGVRSKSMLSERYGVINRLRITRKFWPSYMPVVWMSLWLVVLDRAVHGEWARARLVLQLMFKPQQWLRDNSA